MTRSIFSQWINRITLVLAVTGLAACDRGDLKYIGPAPQPVDFGDVLVFTTSAGQALTWQNFGNETQVLGVTTRPNPIFELAPGTLAITQTVDTNDQYARLFVFKPTALGPVTGKAKLVGPKHETVDLKGTGVAYAFDGDLSIGGGTGGGGGAPTQAVDFGRVQVGTSSHRVILVTNSRPAVNPPVPITATVKWSRNDQGFTSAPPEGGVVSILPSNAVNVTITFTPAAVGTFEDSVVIKDASGNSVTGIMVTGQGANEVENPGGD